MRQWLKFYSFGMLLIVQMVCFRACNTYPHGQVVGVHYRGKERVKALFDYKIHPSTETEAAYQREFEKMKEHVRTMNIVALALFVIADGIFVYYAFFYAGKRDTSAT